MNQPSHELAQRIIERLVAEKLVVAADAEKLSAKLAEGTLRAEDWRVAVEKSAEEEPER